MMVRFIYLCQLCVLAELSEVLKVSAEAALSSLRKLRKGFYTKPEDTEACEKFSPVKDIIKKMIECVLLLCHK
jgi:hypothetical protein